MTSEQPRPQGDRRTDSESTPAAPAGDATESKPLLISRVLLTWAGLMIVGFGGAILGGALSGPPQLVVYLATTLASVAVLFYNVNRLIDARLQPVR
jgi:hypothetical protein